MEIGEYYFSKIQTITLAVLILGLVVGLTLVQREQIIKTRASVNESFRIYEHDENQGSKLIAYQGTYPIKSFDVTIESTSFENRPTAPIKAKVVAPPKVDSIAQCKFTRSGDGPGTEKQIKSSNLISYINEASGLTGIPPVVLAAFIRVESGSTLDLDNSRLESSCPRSTDGGDIGVMQIRQPGYFGHDRAAVDNGARLIGQTVDSLREADYCNPRKNIIIGAGFLLKKLSYAGYGNGSQWNPDWTNDRNAINAMVQGYNGCLVYGGRPGKCEGPYNYGNDIWTSIQNCPVGR